MEMCYGSKGVSNYLDVRIGTEEELNQKGYQFQIRMMEENEVPHLMRPVRMEMDGMVFLKYELNAVYVAERMVRRLKPDGKLFAAWLRDILDCIDGLGQYLLIPDNLVLSPDYMFYRRSDKTLVMLYIPGYERDIRLQMKCLMEYIMQHFDADDRTGIQFLYKSYALVCMENADVRKLRKYIRTGDDEFCGKVGRAADMADTADMEDREYKHGYDRCGEESVVADGEKDVRKEAHMAVTAEKFPETGFGEAVKLHISVGRIIILTANFVAAVYMLFRYYRYGHQAADIWLAAGLAVVMTIHVISCFGEREDADAVMREYEQLQDVCRQGGSSVRTSDSRILNATDMTSESDNIHSLVPLTNGALHEIRLDGTRKKCVVGRGREETDYRIATTQISRVHACIYRQKEGIFIEDRDSTNGTYINAVKIRAMEPCKLAKGDIVSFANEEFFVS